MALRRPEAFSTPGEGQYVLDLEPERLRFAKVTGRLISTRNLL